MKIALERGDMPCTRQLLPKMWFWNAMSSLSSFVVQSSSYKNKRDDEKAADCCSTNLACCSQLALHVCDFVKVEFGDRCCTAFAFRGGHVDAESG